MTTVAEIVEEVFEAVALEFSDVVQDCTLTKTAQGDYNTTTGQYAETTTTYSGKAIIVTGSQMEGGIPSTIKDQLPAYTSGPHDEVIMLQGLSAAPKENDTLTIGSVVRHIKAVGDVVGVGTFFIVIAIATGA